MRSKHKHTFALLAAFVLLLALGGCDKKRDEKTKTPAETPSAPAVPSPLTSLPPVECRWADSPIKVDGSADDAAWANAQTITDFRLPWLKDKPQTPRMKSSAKLLWDHDALYFYAEMDDADLSAKVTQHDGTAWEDDVFELFFKPAADKTGYYEFEVNAANTILDMFIPLREKINYPKFASEPPFKLETVVKLRGTLNNPADKDQGWSVEGKIIWRNFLPTGGRPNTNEIWAFALCRGDTNSGPEGNELTTNAPLSVLSFHRHEEYLPLKFIPAPDSAAKPFGLKQRIPWNDSKVVGTPEPPPPFVVKRVFAKNNLPYTIHVYHEPGTKNLLVLNQISSWVGVGRLQRIKEDENSNEVQQLHAPDRIIYGMAFHPNYTQNGYLYLGSNGPQSQTKRTTGVTRVTIDRNPPHAIVPNSEVTIIEWPSDGHNGGDLVFGKDGMLYVTSGDGTSDSDRDVVGQDLTKLNSKVLRIDVLNPEPGKMYSVPKDNPFVGDANVRPETWAYGLRNPWRIASDPVTGYIWVGNNGQDLWEQAYLIQKGANYGWSIQEGSKPFYPDRKRGPQSISGPAVEHPHSESRSLTGGQVYYGSRYPELRGMYIYGDFSTGKIWGARHDGTRLLELKELADTTIRITGFGFDSTGELLITDHGGGIYKLEPSPPAAANAHFPRKLSETGLFASVAGHKVHPGLIPYSVNAPLWSDGAHKERFIALPGGESGIGVTGNRGWDFPDNAILVKSFAYDRIANDPSTRFWIETRLMVKQQQAKWVGYTYRWNAEQTDATLVDREGADAEFTVADATAPGGMRTQKWHFPSRTECMVCHSRAFNFVLGTSTVQMNKTHDYNGVLDNQLRALEHIGALRVKYADGELDLVRREGKRQGLVDEPLNKFVERWAPQKNQREASMTNLLFKPYDTFGKLVDPYDSKQDLTLRVRSYLHANCAQCHVEAGGGNAAMELDQNASLENMRIIDVTPNHDAFGIANAKLIAPGDVSRSIIPNRMSRRGPGQMPPLATNVPDEKAIALIKEWIGSLKK